MLQLFDQSDLKILWGAAVSGQTEAPAIRINSSGADAGNAAAIATKRVDVKPGSRFDISFEARGDIPLQGMFTLFSGKEKGSRLDFLSPEPLDADWRKIVRTIIVPPGVDSLQLNIFCWRKNGFFEIRDFRVSTPEE